MTTLLELYAEIPYNPLECIAVVSPCKCIVALSSTKIPSFSLSGKYSDELHADLNLNLFPNKWVSITYWINRMKTKINQSFSIIHYSYTYYPYFHYLHSTLVSFFSKNKEKCIVDASNCLILGIKSSLLLSPFASNNNELVAPKHASVVPHKEKEGASPFSPLVLVDDRIPDLRSSTLVDRTIVVVVGKGINSTFFRLTSIF